jgi:hypothetical protein
VNYNSLNSEILKINSKIRYAGVYHTGSEKIYEKMQKGISRLSDREQTLDTLIHEYMRWKARAHYSSEIGELMYSVTKYEKINRLTIPVHHQALLMINTEPDLEADEFIGDVKKLSIKYSDDPNYTPKTPYMG